MATADIQQWREGTHAKALRRGAGRQPVFETTGGTVIEPLYGPWDLAGWSYDEKLGFPGEFPYTRGVQPTMYRGRFWTMRQYAGFADAEESNRRYRYLLDQG